ncbi:MAG: hypothetical protein QXI11_04330 [Thermoproteota archaeon]
MKKARNKLTVVRTAKATVERTIRKEPALLDYSIYYRYHRIIQLMLEGFLIAMIGISLLASFTKMESLLVAIVSGHLYKLIKKD